MNRWNLRSVGTLVGLLVLSLATMVSGCKKQPGATGAEGSGSGAAPTGDLVIGAYLSLTGAKADFGAKTRRGAELALDEANAAGGVGGRKVRLDVLDDQGTADEAGSAVNRLIDVNGAVAIMGEVASSLSLVGGRIAQQKGIPMVSPSSTNTQVTEIGDFIFRVCFIDPFQGKVMATFAREKLKLDRVAVFKDVRNDYSIGLSAAFIEEFKRLGGQVVGEESYNEGDTDFSAQLTKIKGLDPQALFVPGYYTEVGNIARQSRRLGLNVPLLGGDGWEGKELHEIGGADIVGSYYTNHFAPDNPSEKSKAFIDAYKARYNEPPTALAAQGYDATALIIDAMRRAPQPTPAAIRDALAATRDYAGVTGSITFDERRNPTKGIVVLRVDADGTDKFVAQISPDGKTVAEAASSGSGAPAAEASGAPAAANGSGAVAPAAGNGSGAPR